MDPGLPAPSPLQGPWGKETRRAQAERAGRCVLWVVELCLLGHLAKPRTHQKRLGGRTEPAAQHQQHDVGQEAGHVQQAAAERRRGRPPEARAQQVAQHDHRHPEVQQEEEHDEGVAVREDAAGFQDDGQGSAAHGHHRHVLQEPGQEAGGRVHPHHPQVLQGRKPLPQQWVPEKKGPSSGKAASGWAPRQDLQPRRAPCQAGPLRPRFILGSPTEAGPIPREGRELGASAWEQVPRGRPHGTAQARSRPAPADPRRPQASSFLRLLLTSILCCFSFCLCWFCFIRTKKTIKGETLFLKFEGLCIGFRMSFAK